MENTTEPKGSKSRVKKEMLVFLVSLLAAMGMVLFSSYNHGEGFSDVLQQLHLVLLGALAIYALYLLFRLIFWGVVKLVK